LRGLGKALHISHGGNIIVKVEGVTPSKLGVEAFDEKLNLIGHVADVLGPRSSPYVSIKPSIPDPTGLIGRRLYLK